MIGREDDVRQVRHVLARTGACTLVGPGGIGKSTLVSALVDPLGDRAIAIDARSISRADQLLTELAVRLDVDHIIGTYGDDRSQLCAWLAARVSAADLELLAIDHFDGPSDGVIEALTQLTEHLAGVAVLVSTRNHPLRPFGQVVRLRPLELARTDGATKSASAALFSDTFALAGGDPSELEAHPDVMQQALEATGGLPLAIIVVASRAALVGLAHPGVSADAAGLDLGSTTGTDAIGAVLERSLCDLDEDAHRVFRAAGAMRSPPLLAQVAAVSGLGVGTVETAVERLARRSLVEVSDGRVQMLPPVRQLAHSLATASGERALLEQRLVHWADDMSRTNPPPSTSDVLAVEDDLMRAIAFSFGEDQLSTTISIARLLDDALRADLRHQRRVETLEPVLRACREASEREPDSRERRDDVIEMLRVTAMAQSDAGRSAAANRLLDDATALVDRSSQPQTHLARIASLRAGLCFEFGDLAAARSYAASAIECATRSGEAIARHTATRVLSDVALETGELDAALVMVKSIVRDVSPSLTWLRGYAIAAVGACELERGARTIAASAAHQVAIAALERGDRDLLVEADWLAAMADPRRPPAHLIHLAGDRVGNSVIHIQADIATALRQLAAGAPDSAITLAADCELRANALPMRSLAIDAQLLVGAAAVELDSIAEATRAYRQALVDATTLGYRLRVPDALDGLADTIVLAGQVDLDPDAVRGTAAAIRSHLGAVARPRPWRPTQTIPADRPPADWVEDSDLTNTALQALLAPPIGTRSTAAHPTSRLALLSPAERVVAELVAEGKTNREIGESLYVSRRTVETHIAHAFQKLDVKSRTQLAAIVLNEHRR